MLRGFELLLACVSRLEEIGAAAAKEFSLEKAMEKMKLEWRDLVFEFLPYREGVSSQLHSVVTHAFCKYKKRLYSGTCCKTTTIVVVIQGFRCT